MECQRLESFVGQDRHVHNCPGDTEGDAAGEAAGDAEAPGCVDGCSAGGFTAAAGCPRASEFSPATEGGFGVPLACGEADGEGVAAPAPPGAAEESGAVGASAGAA